jgi:hypothetical protein
MSLHAYRGLLAVGRLLNDPALVHEAMVRLAAFAERGFYHDGLWRQADAGAHRRVVGLFDGWIDRLAAGASEVPMLALARGASAVTLTNPAAPELLRASWPAPLLEQVPRHPGLLGGAGLARLAVGRGDDALDLELRGLDTFGAPHFQRQAVRLQVGGRPVLGDLDELPPIPGGWDRATASHNTVVVDGLNQRESLAQGRVPAPAGQFLFFAADPDFQVASLDDPHAYPQSTTRYRQTLIAAASAHTRYAVSVFEVHGGLQHDQLLHAAVAGPGAAPMAPAGFELAVPLEPAPETLLPASITFMPTARAEDGRWFVQFYGELALLGQARLTKPTTARLVRPGGHGVRVHLLGDWPMTAYSALSTDPTAGTPAEAGRGTGRAGLVLRRRSADGATLRSTFVTLFEPLSRTAAPLARVGRVAGPAETVVLYLETKEGGEHLVINLAPGKVQNVKLADGRALRTDGLVVRVTPLDLMLAGGTFVETGRRTTRQQPASGTIVAVTRGATTAGRGWFLSDRMVPDPDALVGRTLLIRHGDGTTHGWTLTRVENTSEGDGARLHVHEEPGFLLDRDTGNARYYQFPRKEVPGPHEFTISRMTRASLTGPLPAVDVDVGARSGSGRPTR